MPYKNFLGYDKGKDGKPIINEKEAEIVRLIYRLFLQVKTASGICKHLDGLGIPTPTGRKAWNQTTINSILRNEKYKGDALLQKKFTVDFLTKKHPISSGQILLPQLIFLYPLNQVIFLIIKQITMRQ